MGQPLWEKLNIKLSYDPTIPLLGIHPPKLNTGTQIKACMYLHIHGNTTHYSQGGQKLKCPWADECRNKIQHSRTMESIRPSVGMVCWHVTTWRNVKNVMVNGRSLNQEVVWFHSYEMSRTGKSAEKERRSVDWGWGGREPQLHAEGFLSGYRKGFGTRWRWWLHNIVNTLKATASFKLFILEWLISFKMVNFTSRKNKRTAKKKKKNSNRISWRTWPWAWYPSNGNRHMWPASRTQPYGSQAPSSTPWCLPSTTEALQSSTSANYHMVCAYGHRYAPNHVYEAGRCRKSVLKEPGRKCRGKYKSGCLQRTSCVCL